MASPTLDMCLDKLKTAKSDNDVFVALILLGNMGKKQLHGEMNSQIWTEMFEYIGFKFFRNMLYTDGECSTYIKQNAITILSVFATIPELATHEDMLRLVPLVGRIITDFSQKSEEEEEEESNHEIVDEAYDIICCVGSYDAGLKHLRDSNVVKSLCHAAGSLGYGWVKARNILTMIGCHGGKHTFSRNPDALIFMVEKFAELVKPENKEFSDTVKWECLSCLQMIMCFVNQDMVDTDAHDKWSSSLRNTCNTLLRCRLDEKRRHPVLYLAIRLTTIFSVRWALEAGHKFLLLLCHLVSVEVRMTLEDNTYKQVDARALDMKQCYNFLTLMLDYMNTNESSAHHGGNIAEYYGAMRGAFQAVYHFMKMLEPMGFDFDTEEGKDGEGIEGETAAKGDDSTAGSSEGKDDSGADENKENEPPNGAEGKEVRFTEINNKENELAKGAEGQEVGHSTEMMEEEGDGSGRGDKSKLDREDGKRDDKEEAYDIAKDLKEKAVLISENNGTEGDKKAIEKDLQNQQEESLSAEEATQKEENTNEKDQISEELDSKEQDNSVQSDEQSKVAKTEITKQTDDGEDSMKGHIGEPELAHESDEATQKDTSTETNQDNESTDNADQAQYDTAPLLPPLVIYTVETLGEWIQSMSPESLDKEVIELLPYLVSICNFIFAADSQQPVRADFDTDHKPNKIVPSLLPAFENLMENSEARTVMLNEDLPQFLDVLLHNHWAQYTRMERFQRDVKADRQPANVRRMMATELLAQIEKLMNQDMAVLLKIIILEVELIQTHNMYQRLCNWALTNLPYLETADNRTELSFNVMTMGLMLCRHLANANKGPDPAIVEPFFDSCITLISEAITTRQPLAKGHSGPVKIRVAEQYEKFWPVLTELWFLSINSLAECVSLYPQPVMLLVDGGWLADILKMLKQVKADNVAAEHKVAFRVLLSTCAEHDSDCREVLKKNGGLQVAKKYGFERLASILSS